MLLAEPSIIAYMSIDESQYGTVLQPSDNQSEYEMGADYDIFDSFKEI